MHISDYTLTEAKRINVGDVLVITLSAFGISPSFNYNLEKAIRADDVVEFIDIKKEVGSTQTTLRIVSKYADSSPKLIIDYINDLANSWDITGAFLFNVKVDSIKVWDYEEAQKQFKEEEKQAEIKQQQKQNGLVGPSITETLFGKTKPLSETLFGFSGTHITIIVLGLGAFLIWTKLPSFKGK